MKISELIGSAVEVLATEGDLDVYITNIKDGDIDMVAVVTGGWIMVPGGDKKCFWVSPIDLSEKKEG